MNGRFLITADFVGVAESFSDVPAREQLERIEPALAQIRAGACPMLGRRGMPVFHIFKEGCGNFGHLLAEILPKLVHVAAIGVRRCAILVPQAAERFEPILTYVAGRFGLEIEPILCPEGSVIRVERLLYVGPVSLHNTRKSPTMRIMAERLLPLASERGTRRKPFVTRPPGGNRAILNQAPLEELVCSLGYEIVEPSTLSFADQIALFSGAHTVLGPMGAALTNAVFMQPGTRMSMICTSRFDAFFWDLACLKEQEFNWVFTEEIEAYRPAMLWEPVAYDLERLRGVLPWLDSDVP